MSVVRHLDESVGAAPSRVRSLTDLQLKALKPRDKAYRSATGTAVCLRLAVGNCQPSVRLPHRPAAGDADSRSLRRGSPSACTWPLDVLDYGMGLSLAEARLLLIKAKRSLEQGVSPSRAKAEKKAAETDALTFGKWVERYFEFKGDPKS